MGLDEAKEVIRNADRTGSPYRCFEMDAAVVYEDGWIDIGDDHYFNPVAGLLAGPGGEGAVRIVAEVPPDVLDRIAEDVVGYDIAMEWDRQVAMEPLAGRLEDESERSPDSANIGRLARERKCACDT